VDKKSADNFMRCYDMAHKEHVKFQNNAEEVEYLRNILVWALTQCDHNDAPALVISDEKRLKEVSDGKG